MKKWILLLSLMLGTSALAHDEGHGPKLTDSPKQGGVVAPVIKESEASKHAAAGVVYKGELVRSEDGSIRVYLYDQSMSALPLAQFEKTAHAILESKKKKKWMKTPFDLKLDGDAFVGKMPPPSKKPFNIDVHLTEGNQKLLVAFDNLD